MDLSHSFMETLLEFESKLLITAQRRNLKIERIIHVCWHGRHPFGSALSVADVKAFTMTALIDEIYVALCSSNACLTNAELCLSFVRVLHAAWRINSVLFWHQ